MHELYGQKNDLTETLTKGWGRLHQADFHPDDLVIAGNGSAISQMKSRQAKKEEEEEKGLYE